jgi:hypothetical protein
MPQRWFVSGGLTLLGLALGTGAFAEDDARGKIEATIKAKNEAILKKLEKPIPLRVKGLPLGEVFSPVAQPPGVETFQQGVRMNAIKATVTQGRLEAGGTARLAGRNRGVDRADDGPAREDRDRRVRVARWCGKPCGLGSVDQDYRAIRVDAR